MEIVEALSEPATLAASQPQAAQRIPVTPIILIALVATLAASVVVWNLKPQPPLRARRLEVSLPPTIRLDTQSRWAVAVSPEGHHLVFGANGQLYLRSMDQLEATPMRDTEGAQVPFFSPDGQWVGFWTGADLEKVPLGGGSSQRLCSAPALTGVTWGPDNTIFFSNAGNIS